MSKNTTIALDAFAGEIDVHDGESNVTASIPMPSPTMQENEKYPYTQWNVGYLRKQLDKDLRRVAQTVANFVYVSALVEARGGTRSEAKAESEVEKLTAKLAAAREKLAALQAGEIPVAEQG